MLAPWVRRHWLLKHRMIAAQQSCGNKTPTQHLVGLGNFEEPGAVVSQRESWAPKTSTPESNRTETQISGRDFPLWIVENHAQIGWTIMRSYPANWERPKKVWKPCGENWSDPQQRQQDPESLFPAFLSAPHTVTHRFLMGLCATSFLLIYPRSSVDIPRNHPEGLSMLACMTIGWADTDHFNWSHGFWPLSWKQNTFSYYITLESEITNYSQRG